MTTMLYNGKTFTTEALFHIDLNNQVLIVSTRPFTQRDAEIVSKYFRHLIDIGVYADEPAPTGDSER